jgi:hypothetical protein
VEALLRGSPSRRSEIPLVTHVAGF